ncbi:hypothetical protein LZZ90_13755 [Flavobacterium sp. SM15]|uniref:hypothetical protein n=1 Tax=Flavobacterium sp. SM15 TaxID=2908005 RepID=UPI001EDC7013|nr:hypothetical protein [Flavobacterium sp. SM15]MCG2612575.1 hypothetical protein [Flavobacterium sp. SM15]
MEIFKKNMFLLSLISGAISYVLIAYQQIGINKTVGWAYQDKDISTILLLLLCAIFIIFFGILKITKIQTNNLLSIINIILIFVSLITNEYIDHIAAIFISLTNFIIFLVNIILSIKNRKLYKY